MQLTFRHNKERPTKKIGLFGPKKLGMREMDLKLTMLCLLIGAVVGLSHLYRKNIANFESEADDQYRQTGESERLK